MKEIIGGNLDLTFKILGIEASKTHNGGYYQVWELEDIEYNKLEALDDQIWEGNWGWWRYSEGSNIGSVNKRFSINGHWIYAWKGANIINKYSNLIEYINTELDLSSERNICALTVDLAQQNRVTLSELFNKYQSIN